MNRSKLKQLMTIVIIEKHCNYVSKQETEAVVEWRLKEMFVQHFFKQWQGEIQWREKKNTLQPSYDALF